MELLFLFHPELPNCHPDKIIIDTQGCQIYTKYVWTPAVVLFTPTDLQFSLGEFGGWLCNDRVVQVQQQPLQCGAGGLWKPNWRRLNPHRPRGEVGSPGWELNHRGTQKLPFTADGNLKSSELDRSWPWCQTSRWRTRWPKQEVYPPRAKTISRAVVLITLFPYRQNTNFFLFE